MNTTINGNDLISLGYSQNHILGVALKINRKRNGYTKAEMLQHYKSVLENPEQYLDNKIFHKLAVALIEGISENEEEKIPLKNVGEPYALYGSEHIEEGAHNQMEIAMRLPVALAGALMPDAHQGYGLPIGGVLATRNAIIPYGVGVDIGCRMALSIFDISETYFQQNHDRFKQYLIDATRFGAGHGYHGQHKSEHEVLDREEFNLSPFIKNLQDKAWSQLGTSGGGNHFVEWGIIQFDQRDERLNIEQGKYLALLSHSGSRGLGATIAGHYTQLAKNLCKLPQEAKNLAYLDLQSEAGQEYWLAMNLAGDYASACHQIIHQKLVKATGAQVLGVVENHHNFAWKEMWNGEEVIVHRKGATPAAEGVMGIIPGSMTAPGFLVRGKGNSNSLNSASHGAGRKMSRTQAIKSVSKEDMVTTLKQNGVCLIGAGLDEAPMAYKDIHKVMDAQNDLVDIVATFSPKIVRMADDGSKED
jgi:tRNA-splicing ligase RtcB